MVSLSIVQSSNSRISSTLPPGLVAVFVGATSGIGEISLKKFAEYTNQPRLYFVGRSQDAADRIVSELKVLNPTGEYIFIKADVSLIRVVDEVSKEIKAKENVINLLFLSAGVPSMDRSETTEHVHLLATLNYYSRLRFINNLLPNLQAATALRRVVTVGGGGTEGPLDQDDFPALRVPHTNLRGHLTTLITLGLEAVAASAPDVSFIHDYPGTVRTPLLNYLSEEQLKGLIFVPIDECGERHLYLATSARYPPAKGESHAVPLGEGVSVASGTTGLTGSGVYSVGSDCESASKDVQNLLAGLREKGLVHDIWAHTEGEYKRITELDGRV